MTAGGDSLGAEWGLPLAGMLLSIALLPLLAPGFWHRHAGKVAVAWSLVFLLPYAALVGVDRAAHGFFHALLADYLPFILLLTALYTTAGGTHIRIRLLATPALNTGLLAIGAAMASVIGTTGASMLLIRPLLRANLGRPRAAHVVVFFIFIVANIGGALTPLGDPPLFLGFLQGVGFFWPLQHLLVPMLSLLVCLLALFHALDSWIVRGEPPRPDGAEPVMGRRIGVRGAINLGPLLAIIALVLMSGVWKPGIAFHVLGVELGLQQVVRDLGLVIATLLSLAITPAGVRAANGFSWAPMREVAELFIGIFVTMIPVLASLQGGEGGALGAIVHAVSGADGQPLPWAYFWATGILSSFLDNAPTYLVFFNLAGGDAGVLMARLAPTLAAISAGAVFMGAMTYVGNAPNLMVKAIAENEGVRMPSFFGYMAWSGVILAPLFLILTFLFFR